MIPPSRFQRSVPVPRSVVFPFLLLACVLLPVGCKAPPTAPPPAALPTLQQLPQELHLRVRIAPNIAAAEIQEPSSVEAAILSRGAWQWRTYTAPLRITRRDGLFMLQDRNGRLWNLSRTALAVRSPTRQPLRLNGKFYPGTFILLAPFRPTTQADLEHRFDVINYVNIEDYLPGVLERELYASWHPETFKAQAVAARSYALAMRSLHAARPFDLESTVASQSYSGLASIVKARQAVADTRGLVLTWDSTILPAFYSSCCGGTGQDAAAVFPDISDLPPLRGRYHGSWCAASPSYRWGPLTIDRLQLTQRLAAWGRANRHPLAHLRLLSAVTVASRNEAGRPTSFRISDVAGQRFPLRAEDFRFACNFDAGATGTGSEFLKSSHVEVQVRSNHIFFYDGRGHGHGVGLCQWGAQALAQAGYSYASILAFYYPGARIEKAY